MKEYYDNLDFELVKQAVANHCSFSLGKEYIINEQPQFNYLWIERENRRGKEALRLYEAYRSPGFGGVHDISNGIQLIDKGGIVSCEELYQVASFSRACQAIKKYMQSSDLETLSIQELVDALSIQKEIFTKIEASISAAYEVKDSASIELKQIRNQIRQCESDISKSTQEVIAKHASILMENITAVRNNRTCVLVKVSDKNKIKGFIHGESASGQAVYIEPEILLKLNNKLQTLLAKEKDEIHRILKSLCLLIQPQCHAYLSDLDTITLLDVLFAKAAWAFQRCGIYADIEEKGMALILKDARHPLIEEEKVVSNTYSIKPPYHHLLVTGSNTGGKTVALKTIGLFSVLSLSGFPILCEEALIPCFDGIYVDIGDSQSIVESLSTFSAHLSKLAYICNQASEHSLVLLDELGSGTDPIEGECLAIATLDYFREKNIMCIATTHYSKLKEYAKKQEDVLIASLTFNMEKMCPTYRYVEGYSGQSNALEIASRYHLNEKIVSKAYSLKEESKSENQILMEKLDADFIELHQRDNELNELQIILEEKDEKLKQQEEQLLIKKNKMIEEAKKKAEEIIEEAKENAELVIEELKGLNNTVKEHELIEIKRKLNIEEIEENEEEVLSFKEKDYVKLKNLGYHGEIVAVKGNRATVFANGMKMNVKTSELVFTQRPVSKKIAVHTSKRTNSQRVNSECNLIGMRVEEALTIVDKYIDSCIYAKMWQLRIIHGHGTGALRKAIHEYLKRNKSVESYRLGGEGEGGLGATIVVLKHGAKNG